MKIFKDKLRYLVGVVLAITIFVPLTVYADSEFVPYVSLSRMMDSNIYRLDDDFDETASSTIVSRDDVVLIGAAGLNFDLSVSRQKFSLNGRVSKNQYENNDQLNNIGKSLSAKWDWVIGNHFKGVLSTDRNIALSGFENTTNTEKSERTTRKSRFSADWHYHPSWKAGVSVQVYDSFYDNQSRKISDLERITKSINWFYLPSTRSRVGVKLSSALGRYPNRQVTTFSTVDDEYEQNSASVVVNWKFSAKSSFDATVGLVSREHPNVKQRNFDGFNADVGFDWSLAERWLLSLGAYKKIVSSEDFFANYTENTGYTLSSVWVWSEKIRYTLSHSSETRDYLGKTNFIPGVGSDLKDRYVTYSLGARYQPFKNVDLGLDYSLNNRYSNQTLRDYGSETINLSLTVNF